MAHVQHFKAGDVKRLCNEYEREKELNNKDGRIDSERTKDNYQLPSNRRMHYQLEYEVEKRVNEVPHSNRKDLNVMSTWIVTLPEQLKTASEADKRRFFETAYGFTQDRYGSENVMTGYVHMDETTPHIHIPTVPVDKNGRISSKNVFTRKELQGYQQDLDALMEQEFGMKGLILNGRTKGDYTVQELKERTKQEQALAKREASLDARESNLKRREASLSARESDLKAQEARFRRTADKTLSKLENALTEAYKAVEDYEKQTDWYNLDVPARKKLVSQGKGAHSGNGASHLQEAATTAVHYADSEQNSRIVRNIPDWMREDVEKTEKLRKEEGYYSLF